MKPAGRRDLFAIVKRIVELSSVKHTPQNHQHNCHQYNTHSSRITKFVFGRSSAADLAGGAHEVPHTPISAGDKDQEPLEPLVLHTPL